MPGHTHLTDPRSRRSRDQILDALHRSARSNELTTMSALSAAAGVTRATIYNHFDTLEEAAWFAMLDSFEHLLESDVADRRQGAVPELVGVESLRKIVELLRAERPLVRLADTYRSDSVLPGLAGIVLETTRTFRANSSAPPTANSEAQDVFVSAGLYALIAAGAEGQRDPAEIAQEAYALLPDWMQQPGL